MIKRTTGRLLLTLLVTTGLAGTLNNSSLSQKERKQAINLIKSSRKEVLNSMGGLSSRQLKFKPSSKELKGGKNKALAFFEKNNFNRLFILRGI